MFLRPVEILTTSTETVEDTTVVKFSVKADIVPPAPAPTALGPGQRGERRREHGRGKDRAFRHGQESAYVSPKAQLTVFALLSMLAVGGAWRVLLGPAEADIANARTRLGALEGEVNKAQMVALKLPQRSAKSRPSNWPCGRPKR